MAAVVVTPTAAADLDRLITTLSLPPDTRARFKRSVASLAQFPLIGSPLHGRWSAYRFLLGPWRWMIVVYVCDALDDRVAIVTIQDARSGRAATSG
jgi:plasmid stabilization system protein ParE